MSLEASIWAWRQRVGRSTAKLVLLSIAERAGRQGTSYPSVERISADTELDRKTVLSAIKYLEASGLIVATRQPGRSTDYALVGFADRAEQTAETSPKNGTRTKIGTSPENGTEPVPFLGPNQYRFWDPNLSGTYQEPEKKARAKARSESNAKSLDYSVLPDDLSEEIWQDFLTHRKKSARAPITTQTAINQTARELEKARAEGWTPDEAIAETISAGWRGVKATYLRNRREQTDETSQRNRDPASAAERVRKANERAGYGPEPAPAKPPRTIRGERLT